MRSPNSAKTSVRKVAVAFKESRRLWFRDLLVQLGVAEADALATQLALLVDGSIAQDLVRNDPAMARAAKEAATVLLRNAGVTIGGVFEQQRWKTAVQTCLLRPSPPSSLLSHANAGTHTRGLPVMRCGSQLPDNDLRWLWVPTPAQHDAAEKQRKCSKRERPWKI